MFAGQVCIVFGAAQADGLGFAFAKEAGARHGMRVALCDVDRGRLMEREMDLSLAKVECCIIPLDIADPEQVSLAGLRAQQLLGCQDVGIVINFAGLFAEDEDQEKPDVRLWELAYRINVLGAVYVNKMALALNQTLHLVQVSSLSAFTGGTGEPYASTKLALTSLVESLQRSKPRLVSPHLVLPGVVQTKFASSSYRIKQTHNITKASGPTPAVQRELKEMIQLGLHPDHVATKIFQGLAANRFYITVDNALPIDLDRVFAKKSQALLVTGQVPDYLEESGKVLDGILLRKRVCVVLCKVKQLDNTTLSAAAELAPESTMQRESVMNTLLTAGDGFGFPQLAERKVAFQHGYGALKVKVPRSQKRKNVSSLSLNVSQLKREFLPYLVYT
ncbi:hypothetical protein BASA81_004164 [Batrachochytrium salamandrivorans]|nr:hypothetical protein BASA81_004164 [Batrachochytrium salamandrivorans]